MEDSDVPLPSPTAASLPPPRKILPPHELVLAPMVGASELAYRLLCRRHGAQLCYTPMMHADKFAADRTYRAAELQTAPDDAPLVAHFCGNEPRTLLRAAKLAQDRCCAVDLNLGCPQRSAHSGNYGSFLCATESGRAGVLRIVSTLALNLAVPVFCKIRLLDGGEEETVAFARQLEAAGCALLAVHGRLRGDPMHRRKGPADLSQVRAVKAALRIPVLTNGNVRSADELLASLRETGADGVMSAEAALDDAALFGRAAEAARRRRRRLRRQARAAKELRAARRGGRTLSADERRAVAAGKAARAELRAMPAFAKRGGAATSGATAPLDLADQYLALAAAHPPPAGITCVTFHLRRLCRDLLTQYELLTPLLAATTLAGAARVVARCRELADGRAAFVAGGPPFVAEPPEEKALHAALARHPGLTPAEAEAAARAAAAAASARKRTSFEERMVKRARAEGLADDQTYVRAGLTPPSAADVAAARAMGAAEQRTWWAARFGRHCREAHIDGRCPWELDPRGCGYLHPGEPAGDDGACEMCSG